MSFDTYSQGLRLATDLANKAINIEASLSALSPLVSPLPTLQKAFPVYISSAEAYSYLLASKLVPASEISNVKKRWRLVLERAEKVKTRVEQLGGHVGKAQIGDEGEEAAVKRRGGRINNLDLELWSTPREEEFTGKTFVDTTQPELAEEQVKHNPVWKVLAPSAWEHQESSARWTLRQGPVADCSVVSGLSVGLAHNHRHQTALGATNLYPQDASGQPRRSDNGKHVLKLLLNGAWRSVTIDALLPYSTKDGTPLYSTSHPLSDPASSGPAWVPLALKGYFKAFGGYSIRGRNPAPDIYAFTGWIPEHISLKEGFQREKEWDRIFTSWSEGKVMITLGTGEYVDEGMVKLHAYGVVGLQQEGDQRLLEITDPGASDFMMSWDQVCGQFEALNLNWDPKLLPIVAEKHWTWSKPAVSTETTQSNPQYRLQVTSQLQKLPEIWILLSQHITSKDRPLDDIAIHIFEEYGDSSSRRSSGGTTLHPQRVDQTTPFANSVHVLVRYRLRQTNSNLLIIPARDRGNFQTGFTLHALGPTGTSLNLERISRSMPFTQSVTSSITSRNSGGPPGCPTHIQNPQYRLEIGSAPRSDLKVKAKMTLEGDKDVPWNVKVVWGDGRLVADLTGDMVVADTGPYSYGMAFCIIPNIKPGVYTLIVSTFAPGQMGSYNLSVEANSPISLSTIPAEGAGMYNRVINGNWDINTAGGRPSTGGYDRNPRVELILSKPGFVLSRLYLPKISPIPINLTIFRRDKGGDLGEQIATTGPYADNLSGVCVGRLKLESGIYILVPSAYESETKGGWTLKVWSDVNINIELL